MTAFYLYKPFLQMPAIAAAQALSFGSFLPEVSTGNTTVLIQSQVEQNLSAAESSDAGITTDGFCFVWKRNRRQRGVVFRGLCR